MTLVLTAAFAALITCMTAYICHIPVGTNGGYVHFGDTLIYIAACILPKPYAVAAAVIGGGLADVLTAPMWVLPTVIIKGLLCLPFTSKKSKLLNLQNGLSLLVGGVISIGGYTLAEILLFGNAAAAVAGILGNVTQSVGSGILFILLALFLDKKNVKQKLWEGK